MQKRYVSLNSKKNDLRRNKVLFEVVFLLVFEVRCFELERKWQS